MTVNPVLAESATSGCARQLARGTPAPVLKYLTDAAREAIEDRKFQQIVAERGMDADFRAGEALRADLWREYKLHTTILGRIGMLKK